MANKRERERGESPLNRVRHGVLLERSVEFHTRGEFPKELLSLSLSILWASERERKFEGGGHPQRPCTFTSLSHFILACVCVHFTPIQLFLSLQKDLFYFCYTFNARFILTILSSSSFNSRVWRSLVLYWILNKKIKKMFKIEFNQFDWNNLNWFFFFFVNVWPNVDTLHLQASSTSQRADKRQLYTRVLQHNSIKLNSNKCLYLTNFN